MKHYRMKHHRLFIPLMISMVIAAMHWTTSGALGDAPTAELTPVMGKSVAAAEQMRIFLKMNNPDAPDYVDLYFIMEQAEGVRADVAFAQSILETGFFRFGNLVSPTQNNFCGLGATGPGTPGYVFATPLDGIMAQGRHLRLYAVADPELNDREVDPRGLPARLRGTAPHVEDLGGKWAPSPLYGQRIVDILKKILEINFDNSFSI